MRDFEKRAAAGPTDNDVMRKNPMCLEHRNARFPQLTRTVIRLLLLTLLLCRPAPAAEPEPLRLYEITTETVMPHLEENLRYATTREQRCSRQDELLSAFPVLRHDALKGCELVNETRLADGVAYMLACEGDTTGSARWYLEADHIGGTLTVKLGGKNMTFHQRLNAKVVGDCAAETP